MFAVDGRAMRKTRTRHDEPDLTPTSDLRPPRSGRARPPGGTLFSRPAFLRRPWRDLSSLGRFVLSSTGRGWGNATPATRPATDPVDAATQSTKSGLPGLPEGARGKARLRRFCRFCRLRRPAAEGGMPPPQPGRTSSLFPVVLAKRRVLSLRNVRGFRGGAAAEPFRDGRRMAAEIR